MFTKAAPEKAARKDASRPQPGRQGTVTKATKRAGRGTDNNLRGNADYMARLKLREVLLPRLVRPDEDHRPPVPLQRAPETAAGFGAASQAAHAKAPSEARAIGALYPCELGGATDQSLSELAHDLVKVWGLSA